MQVEEGTRKRSSAVEDPLFVGLGTVGLGWFRKGGGGNCYLRVCAACLPQRVMALDKAGKDFTDAVTKWPAGVDEAPGALVLSTSLPTYLLVGLHGLHTDGQRVMAVAACERCTRNH